MAHQDTQAVRIVRWEYMPALSGYLLSFASADSDAFDAAVASVKQLPMAFREWKPDERAWWIHAAVVGTLQMSFPALKVHIRREEARRDYQIRRNGHARGTGSSRSDQTAYAPAMPARVADAFAVLHLAPSAPPELVAAARRVLARLHHPDTGGSHGEMVRINNAADQCEQWLEGRAG